jgi:ABC-type transport system involved in multi-copper enzyme maturation permease subunit
MKNIIAIVQRELGTYFVSPVAYVVLTIVGTFFRGQQMILMWPWDPRQVRLE